MKPILAICVLLLSACTVTPEGKRAKADTVIIQKNAAIAQRATLDAKDGNSAIQADNTSAQTHAAKVQNLDAQIDAKDKVIEQYFRQHENSH